MIVCRPLPHHQANSLRRESTSALIVYELTFPFAHHLASMHPPAPSPLCLATRFRKAMSAFPIRLHDSIAVAISGGSDSLGLALLLSDWARHRRHRGRIVYLTVDHGLRQQSRTETQRVRDELLPSDGVRVLQLHWDGPLRRGSVQKEARLLRYQSLASACLEENVRWLAVGHQLDDQAETVLSRLFRGSGVRGLQAMRDRVELRGGRLGLLRPVLGFRREELERVCGSREWVKDPSNEDERFERARIRKAMADCWGKDAAPKIARCAEVMSKVHGDLVALLGKTLRERIVWVKGWDVAFVRLGGAEMRWMCDSVKREFIKFIIEEMQEKKMLQEEGEIMSWKQGKQPPALKAIDRIICQMEKSEGKSRILGNVASFMIAIERSRSGARHLAIFSERGKQDVMEKSNLIAYIRKWNKEFSPMEHTPLGKWFLQSRFRIFEGTTSSEIRRIPILPALHLPQPLTHVHGNLSDRSALASSS